MAFDTAGRTDDNDPQPALSGALRMAVIFGFSAIAFAMIAGPIAARQTERSLSYVGGELDFMPTASTQRGSATGNYTIRRSVLQESPSAVCIIRSNGTRSGSC